MANFRKATYATWQEASDVVKKFNLESGDDYRLKYDKIDPLLPSNPRVFYPDFPGWKIYLGNNCYCSWQKSRDVSIASGVTNWKEYHELRHKNRKLRSCPADIYSDFVGYKDAFDPFSFTNLLVDYINLPLLEIEDLVSVAGKKLVLEEAEEFSMSY